MQTDHGAFAVETLEGGVGSVDEGDDDLALAGGAGPLDQHVIPGDDVLVAHGVATDFEGEDLAVADDVAERDGFGGFDGLDGLAGGDAAEQRQAFEAFLAWCARAARRSNGCGCGRAGAGLCSAGW